jgi:uncharacterized membrane protein YobD (UPF0266 family)
MRSLPTLELLVDMLLRGVYVTYIGVVSVISQYNGVYYCDTCYIRQLLVDMLLRGVYVYVYVSNI